MAKINVGDTVQLRAYLDKKHRDGSRCAPDRVNNKRAIVKTLMSDPEGGIILDRDLRGMLFWNVADVVVCAKPLKPIGHKY